MMSTMKVRRRVVLILILGACALCFLGSLPIRNTEEEIIALAAQKFMHGQLSCQSWVVRKDMRRANALAKFKLNTNIASKVAEDSENRTKSFVEIFNSKIWGGQEQTANLSAAIIGSGTGSTMKITENVRKTLDVVIGQVKVYSGKGKIRILDIPCGDLTWMSEFMKHRNDVEYYGMDIVPAIIEHHRRVYTPKYPHMTFIHQDIVAEPLHAKFDLIHTRQMTQHLTSTDTFSVLRHLVDSGSQFLMATTVPGVKEVELDHFNRGRHRLQNLETPPYSLPPPICRQQDVRMEYNAVWLLNESI